MKMANQSVLAGFVLLGLSDQPKLERTFFVRILSMYLVILLGNGVLILVTIHDSRLHTPMYFFLGNLSFLDICYTTSSVPLILDSFLTPRKTIPFSACAMQMFLSFAMGATECVLLGMMAFDRYVAICNPLLYNVAMSPNVCSLLMLGSYLMAFSGAMAHTGCILRLTFCDANTINHYLCDILPLLQLSCTSTYVNELVVLIVEGINVIVPTVTIFVSYGFILSSILRISSTEGRSKAFSTCTAHIIAVTLFFGSGAFMYLKPSSAGSMDEGKISSVFYTNVVPMMNPFIYSLRNKDIKIAVRNTLNRRQF